MHALYPIILFPLIGFLSIGIAHLMATRRNLRLRGAGVIATIFMFLSFAYSVFCFFALRKTESGLIEDKLFTWMKLGGLSVDFALRLDSLSIVFVLVITGVGALIHLYSISYMHDDETPAKYFAYLNLFCFMMLNLVLGSSLPHVFLGWEGVGLASYLLIGYWYEDPLKVNAGQKAFVMNRIGDLGFLVAMFIAFRYSGTLDLIEFQKTTFPPHILPAFGLAVFFACTGKSAQIPLFTWLPDAMAGPTPVSALIHAATMVTSGIYLLTRLFPTISSSELVLCVIALTGALTALLAAVMACFQSDIKKILAYSTISQLGFMFLGCGVGAFSSGVFHVMTHAFFKALLFLGAGSVIHALGGEQDVFKMGNLRKKIPITFLTFTAGWAAILGLPPFSGFFSKDEIIYQALASPHGSHLLFGIAMVSAFLTSFYMTRLYVLVFMGESRVEKSAEPRLHESPPGMTIPLVILAVLALIGGWFGSPVHLGASSEDGGSLQYAVMGCSVLLALLGAGLAYRKYSGRVKIETTFDPFKIDRFYEFTFGKGTRGFSEVCARFVEEMVVQRVLRLTSAIVDLSGNVLKIAQVGSVQAYLMMMLLAVIAILAWFFYGVGLNGKL